MGQILKLLVPFIKSVVICVMPEFVKYVSRKIIESLKKKNGEKNV